MEVCTPAHVHSDGNRSCETASHATSPLHPLVINAQAAAAACRAADADADPRKLLQAASTQSRKLNSSSSGGAAPLHVVVVINDTNNNSPLLHPSHAVDPLQIPNHAECRICHDDDDLRQLDTPCACTGTLMYAHRKCVQRWCDEKGGTTCEICQQPYKSGYTAAAQSHNSIHTFMDFRHQVEMLHADEEVEEASNNMVQVVAAAQRRFLDAEYQESNSSSAACCRSAALLLMLLLLLRHALAIAATSSTSKDDTSMLLLLFLLRVAGFLLPCYIVVRAINVVQKRYQHEDVNMRDTRASSTEVSIILQADRL